MAGNTAVKTWAGICLTLLWLGGGGGCCCLDGFGMAHSRLFRFPCTYRAPREPMTCGPCYGYQPTCWLAWSECYCPCPPPEHIGPIPGGPTGGLPLEDDLAPPSPNRGPNREMVPRPKADSPKEKPPKADSPKEKPPLPIAPVPPSSHTSSKHKSDTADWGIAPLPDDILAAPMPQKRCSRSQVHTAAYKQEDGRSGDDG